MKKECTKIEDCLRVLPKLNKILASNKFVVTICGGAPIIELSCLPDGITVESLSREGLDDFFNSNPSIKLISEKSNPGIMLRASGPGSKDIIHIFHITYTRINDTDAKSDKIYNIYSVAENTELNIKEKFFSVNENYDNTVSHWTLQAGAKVTKYVFGTMGDQKNANSLIINNEFVKQFSKSEYNLYPFYFSKSFSSFYGKIINNLTFMLNGDKASCNINSIVILSDSACVENNINIIHATENCQSLQLFKGVYDNESRGDFDSCVIVKKDAQKSNSIQKNNNILLSDKASVQSNPKLEIFADDVECAHGSTTGQVDESALFYLQSRGLSRTQANSVLLTAFVSDVIEKIQDQDIKKVVYKCVKKQFSNCE